MKTVADVMSRKVAVAHRNDTLALADEVMRRENIRHLPVVDDDEEDVVVGVLSQRDLFRGALARCLGYGTAAQGKLLESLFAKEAMSDPPITTTPTTSLSRAARTMVDRKIGCLPVVDGGKLVGILTEGDFVLMAAGAPETGRDAQPMEPTNGLPVRT